MSADVNVLTARLEAIAEGASPAEAANALFPDDEKARNEYVRRADAVQGAYEKAQLEATRKGEASPRVLPAFVAAALPVIARCVIGSLKSAGVNEVLTLVRNGKRATAQSRVNAVVGGCIGGIIPWGWMAKKLKKPIASAVLSIIIRLGK